MWPTTSQTETPSTHRVYQPSRRERLILGWRRSAPVTVALVLIVTILAGPLILSLRRSAAMERDTAGHPILSGCGTVITLLPVQKSGTLYAVEVSVAGQQAWCNSTRQFNPGQPLWVRYRMGRSGALYALSIGPR